MTPQHADFDRGRSRDGRGCDAGDRGNGGNNGETGFHETS
jgi:hypothetical protein